MHGSCVRGEKLFLSMMLAAVMPVMAGSIDRESSFSSRVLATHNRERHVVGVPALAWDEALAASARRRAGGILRSGSFGHAATEPSGQERLGENLWAGTAHAYSPEEMVGLWIEERADFKYGAFPDVSKSAKLERVGHYTQLIWRRTGRVGCAKASNGRDDFLVCRYSVSGNVMGERPI
jgi:hypothetical protein